MAQNVGARPLHIWALSWKPSWNAARTVASGGLLPYQSHHYCHKTSSLNHILCHIYINCHIIVTIYIYILYIIYIYYIYIHVPSVICHIGDLSYYVMYNIFKKIQNYHHQSPDTYCIYIYISHLSWDIAGTEFMGNFMGDGNGTWELAPTGWVLGVTSAYYNGHSPN